MDSNLSFGNGFFSSFTFYLALLSTAFVLLFVLPNVKNNKKRKQEEAEVKVSVSGSDSDSNSAVVVQNGGDMLVERQTGASMMEQLVPEITTHTLSYLDYSSLCSLSMTNSCMRKAANDDTAWKALFEKDFTLEHDCVTPPHGWKAYYAATRAVWNVNAEFYAIISDRSLPAMTHFWLQADYVSCVHGTGELFTGYNAVIRSWQLAFEWDQEVAFQYRDVRVRVLTNMAWVTVKTFHGGDTGPFHVTNVYEFLNGRWYMVHHHSSVVLIDVELDHQNVFG